ncbi:MAG: VacJ family lipoprotein [Pseudomonadota bacterium]
MLTLPRTAAALLIAVLLVGCAANNKKDPLEPLNRGIYQFNDTVDKAVIKPLATVYKDALPQPVRTGVSNFFGNLNDVLNSLNNLLQGKVGAAVSDGGRVLINTSFGMLGLIDVATQAGMPKHGEDFGQTLGRWGVNSGPYLVLPILGPSSLRDAVGTYTDSLADPINLNTDNIPVRNRTVALKMVNRRAELLGLSKVIDEGALDPYAFVRDGYLQKRRSQVYDGDPPPEPEEDEDADEPDADQDDDEQPASQTAPQ